MIDAPIIITPQVISATENALAVISAVPIIEPIDEKNASCHTEKIIPENKMIIPAAKDKPKDIDTADFAETDIFIRYLLYKISFKSIYNIQI